MSGGVEGEENGRWGRGGGECQVGERGRRMSGGVEGEENVGCGRGGGECQVG